MNRINGKVLALLLAAVLMPGAAQADAFIKGSVTASGSIASASFSNEDYLVLGIGAGYFVYDGVQLGLDLDYWSGGNPTIYEVTPRVTYIYDVSPRYKPYLGAFYNRAFIDGAENRDSIGYRAGVYMPSGGNVNFGIGIVHTELQDCTDTPLIDCSETYTEFSVIFSL